MEHAGAFTVKTGLGIDLNIAGAQLLFDFTLARPEFIYAPIYSVDQLMAPDPPAVLLPTCTLKRVVIYVLGGKIAAVAWLGPCELSLTYADKKCTFRTRSSSCLIAQIAQGITYKPL